MAKAINRRAFLSRKDHILAAGLIRQVHYGSEDRCARSPLVDPPAGEMPAATISCRESVRPSDIERYALRGVGNLPVAGDSVGRTPAVAGWLPATRGGICSRGEMNSWSVGSVCRVQVCCELGASDFGCNNVARNCNCYKPNFSSSCPTARQRFPAFPLSTIPARRPRRRRPQIVLPPPVQLARRTCTKHSDNSRSP